MEDQYDQTSEVELALDLDLQKKARIEKEKSKLLASLHGGDFSQQKTRVAFILNLYPESRNSDVTLTLRYWQTFQPDIYNPQGILPQDLFKLERLHYIVRARAKIQNEYGLFTSNSEVKRFRRKHEEKMSNDVLDGSPSRKVVNVFSDESGKNQDFIIVSSVWVLTGRAVYTVSKAITDWKEGSLWNRREIHFSKLGAKDLETLKDFISVILKNREYLSFKTISIQRKLTKRKTEEVVEKLHENMIIQGAIHEVNSKRISLPQSLEVTVDHEQSLDPISLTELQRRINSSLKSSCNEQLSVDGIQAVSSKSSPLVQLSDMIAGAVNRKLNNPGGTNYKDEMADMIIQMLDIKIDQKLTEGDLDSSSLFELG